MSRHSVWPDGSMPVFIDPTEEEMDELAKSSPDTLRICECENHVALASGYGNTHESIIKMARKVFDDRYWHPIDLILFREIHDWYWNPLGNWPTHREKIRLDSGYSQLYPHTLNAIKLFERSYREYRS